MEPRYTSRLERVDRYAHDTHVLLGDDLSKKDDFARFAGHIHTLAWCHLPFSVTQSRMLKYIQAAFENEYDFLILTDHDTTKPFEMLHRNSRLEDTLSSQGYHISRGENHTEINYQGNNLAVYRGQEISTRQGHLLAWFIEQPIKKGRPIIDTAKDIISQGGMVVAAHPYAILAMGEKNLRRLHEEGLLDALEYNATQSPNTNLKALHFATDNGLPVVSNPDAHLPMNLGDAFTEIDKGFYQSAIGDGLPKRLREYIRDPSKITNLHFGKTDVVQSSLIRIFWQFAYFAGQY